MSPSRIRFLILISLLIVLVVSDDLFLKKKKKKKRKHRVSTSNPYPYSSSVVYGYNGYGGAQTSATQSPYGSGSVTSVDQLPERPRGSKGRGSGSGIPYRYRYGSTLYYLPTIQPAGSDSSTYEPIREKSKTKKKKKAPKKGASESNQQQQQQQQQEQQQTEVVNCMNKNKMAKEMEDFKQRAKIIENRIVSGPQLFNTDLSSGYQFLIYDFVSLVEQLGKITIKRG